MLETLAQLTLGRPDEGIPTPTGPNRVGWGPRRLGLHGLEENLLLQRRGHVLVHDQPLPTLLLEDDHCPTEIGHLALA